MARDIDARFTQVRSLWEILHDGVVEAIERDGHRVTLVVDVAFVRRHHALPDDSRFRLGLSGVTSLEVTTWEPPATPAPSRAPETTREDYEQALSAWRGAGTYPEVPAAVFLERLARAEDGFDVYDALLAEDPERRTSRLVLSGMLDGEQWYELAIEAVELVIAERDRPLDVDAFLALGEAYWDAFSERASARSRE